MGNPFEQEIAAAQLRRKRTRIITVCTSVGLLALVAIGYIYTFAVRFEVALLDFPSQVRITVVSGNAVDLGLSRVFLLSGRASIEISAPGYKTASVWLETGRDAAKVVAIALDYSDVGVRMMVKQELTSPAWYVDGILVSSEGELRIELRPGEHLIELVSDHHERAALTTVVPPAVDLVRELELSPRLVGYQIETVPSGGEVFIDGMSIGTSPVRGDYRQLPFVFRPRCPDSKESMRGWTCQNWAVNCNVAISFAAQVTRCRFQYRHWGGGFLSAE